MTPELAKALHAFQKDAPPVHLDATNPHFRNRYASLAGVVGAVRPVLNKHGLVYTQLPTLLDGVPALRTSVIHAESGDEISDVMPLTVSKADAQGYGSALTYARRYALLSVLGLVADEDDDANGASGGKPVSTDVQGDRPTGGAASAHSGASSAGAVRPVATNEAKAAAPADPHGLQESRADAVQPGQVIVPFGKHKGTMVKDVPQSYWDWWLAQDGNKNPEVLAAVELHLGLTATPSGENVDLDIPF
jgi:uncharacterized protein (DUF3820 family)